MPPEDIKSIADSLSTGGLVGGILLTLMLLDKVAFWVKRFKDNSGPDKTVALLEKLVDTAERQEKLISQMESRIEYRLNQIEQKVS